MRRAIVFGATGLVGAALLERLLAGEGAVTVVGRRKIGRAHPRLEEVVVELDRLEAVRLAGDDAYICLGTTIKKAGSQAAFRKVDFDMVVAAARASLAGGARRLAVVSSMGASAGSPFFYNRVKGEMEAAVSELGFESIYLFRPGVLMGDRQEERPAERVAIRGLRAMEGLLVGPLSRLRGVEADDVAAAMIAAVAAGAPGRQVYDSDQIRQLAGRT